MSETLARTSADGSQGGAPAPQQGRRPAWLTPVNLTIIIITLVALEPARLLPVHPPRLPARRHRVRRRALLRQRGPAGARLDALQGLRPRPAARHHPADEPGRAADLLDRHRLGPGHRPDSHGAGRYRRGRPRRAARAPPRAAGGPADLRDHGRLLRRRGRGAHGARRAVAGAVLPGRRGDGVRRRPDHGQHQAPGLGRCPVRFRGRRGGVGDRARARPRRALPAPDQSAPLYSPAGSRPGS